MTESALSSSVVEMGPAWPYRASPITRNLLFKTRPGNLHSLLLELLVLQGLSRSLRDTSARPSSGASSVASAYKPAVPVQSFTLNSA